MAAKTTVSQARSAESSSRTSTGKATKRSAPKTKKAAAGSSSDAGTSPTGAAAKKTAKKPAAKKAPAKKTTQKSAAKKKPAAKKTATKRASAKATGGTKAAATTRTAAAGKTGASATTTAAKKKPARKAGARATGSAKVTAAKARSLAVLEGEDPWTSAELAEVKDELEADVAKLQSEIDLAEEGIAGLMQDAGDQSGDDEADAGAKTFEREQEISLANNSRDLLEQSDHALRRIADGTYGVCESCGNPVGKLRLQAFPRATLCMTCKRKQERR